MKEVPSVTYWGWEAETSTLTIFSRDAKEVLWRSRLGSFKEAQDCADAFDKIHRSGISIGMRHVLEQVNRCVDQIVV